MAVMSSPYQDSSIALPLERKTDPVPSVDKMAVDLDLNGPIPDDESNRASSIPDPAATPSFDHGPVDSVVDTAVASNGTVNTDAVAANSITADIFHAPSTDEALHQNPVDQNKTTSVPSTSPTTSRTTLPTTAFGSQSFDTASLSFEGGADSLAAPALVAEPTFTSSIPPIVDAPESDLRDEPIPDLQESASDIELDLVADMDPLHATALVTDPVTEPASDLLGGSSTHPDSATAPKTEPASILQQDTEMKDMLPNPPKVAREREDDTEEWPSAKRTKVETKDASSSLPSETPPSLPGSNGEVANASSSDDPPPTAHQALVILKSLLAARRTKDGKNFLHPVAVSWPNLADSYAEKIANPVDLGLIEQRLKSGYKHLSDYKADVNLIYENAATFNSVEHAITKSAAHVRDVLLSKIPGPDPITAEKPKKVHIPNAPPRATPARRQSRGGAGSPTAGQTFALPSSGTPIIRRDSTKGDGRPKREIHPPKSKDMIYSARPKKKKFATELKFCEEVLKEMKKPKYIAFSGPFLLPVDPVALNIPQYHTWVKEPMDISTIEQQLKSNLYESSKDFLRDMKLMFSNCYSFNPPGSPVHILGKQYEDLFDIEWAKKARYIADHTVSNAASPSSTVDSDEESEEDELEQASTNASTQIQARLVEEQNKLIQLMQAKKPDAILIRMQEELVGIVTRQAAEQAKLTAKKTKKPVKKPAKRAPLPKKMVSRTKKIFGPDEKELISRGIGQFTERLMHQAVNYIKVDLPDLDLETEAELDIDVLSQDTLHKLYDLVVKNVPGMTPQGQERSVARPTKPQKPKKNKPMNKTEQESKIEKLRALTEAFDRAGSTSDDARGSRGVVASVEQEMSSGDESPSDSEED